MISTLGNSRRENTSGLMLHNRNSLKGFGILIRGNKSTKNKELLTKVCNISNYMREQGFERLKGLKDYSKMHKNIPKGTNYSKKLKIIPKGIEIFQKA